MAYLLLHLLVPLLLALAVFATLLQRTSPAFAERCAAALAPRFFLGCATLGLLLYVVALAFVTMLPVCIDAVEVTISEITVLQLHGHPVYTTLLAPDRYSFLYGPMCYLPFTSALYFMGASLASLKIAVVLMNVTLFLVLFFLFRRLISGSVGFIPVGAFAACLLMKQIATLLIRGDVMLSLAVACTLLATTIRNRILASSLLALAAAAAFDVKFTAAFYLLIPIYIFCKRHGHFAWITLALAGVLAALPFFFHTISLHNYLAWLHQASHHPLTLRLFAMNVVAGLLLLFPVILAALAYYRQNGRFGKLPFDINPAVLLGLLLVTVAGSIVVGSKAGAGRSHLIPSFLVAFYLVALFWQSFKPSMPKLPAAYHFACLGYALVLLIPAISEVRDLWSIAYQRRAYAVSVLDDLHTIERRYPAKIIEIGYTTGGDEGATTGTVTNFKTQPVFVGGPVTVDAAAMFDMQLGGLPLPDETVAQLSACRPTVWLLPKNGKPFGMVNTYVHDVPARFPDPRLFPENFRITFNSAYQFVGSSNYFDIFACKLHP